MKSLGSRLTYWYVLVVSATVVIALLVGRWLLERELVKGMDLLNDAEYREIVDRMDFKHHPPAESEVIERIAAHSRIDAPLYFFQLRNSRGNVIFRSENMGDTVLPEKPPRRTNWSETLPGLEDVRVGVIAARIAAHAGDIAKGVAGAAEWDRKMSTARAAQDWEGQIRLSVDPHRARSVREAGAPHNAEVCSMCGDFCVYKVRKDRAGKSKK